ncbi:hypothetical protein EDC01DRAFT_635846 [Geopyxis carbonaria]|nr:hypothetical protein EDC01DRAFT_635846 [Geopyxis carbonaria]
MSTQKRNPPPQPPSEPRVVRPEDIIPKCRCPWPGCGLVFDSYAKERRHRDTHTVIGTRCPLCADTETKLWVRVDKIQNHLLDHHFPFEIEDVRPAVQSLYKAGKTGRGWFAKIERLLKEHEDGEDGVKAKETSDDGDPSGKSEDHVSDEEAEDDVQNDNE